jgi:hypothetical protein
VRLGGREFVLRRPPGRTCGADRSRYAARVPAALGCSPAL